MATDTRTDTRSTGTSTGSTVMNMTAGERTAPADRGVGSERSAHGPGTVTRGEERALNALDWIAMIVLIIGGINWGLVGLFNFDLVAAIFGNGTTAARVVYDVVGLAALYAIYLLTRFGARRAY